ncbi:hypothetical protein [Rhizobium phaseoli]|nr:hypothetical protein [Rhizobium phaseoli]
MTFSFADTERKKAAAAAKEIQTPGMRARMRMDLSIDHLMIYILVNME